MESFLCPNCTKWKIFTPLNCTKWNFFVSHGKHGTDASRAIRIFFPPTDDTDNSDFSFSLFLMRCCFARRATDLHRYYSLRSVDIFSPKAQRPSVQRSTVIYFSHRLHRFSSYRLIGHGTLCPYILCVYRRPSMISRGRMPLTSKIT